MLNDKVPLHEEEWIEELAIKIFSDVEELTRDKIGVSRESYGGRKVPSLLKLLPFSRCKSEAINISSLGQNIVPEGRISKVSLANFILKCCIFKKFILSHFI